MLSNTLKEGPASVSICGREVDWHISVLIPARNEEALLPRCLFSIEQARLRLPASVTSDVILVDDNSSDATFKIAEEFLQGRGAVVRSSAGAVGTARALAAKTAMIRHQGVCQRHWLANTDADCIVPETWLLDHLAAANENAEAIAGIVSVDGFEEHDPEVPLRFLNSYLFYPDGTHPHIHGANLGVRADAYLRAGGWSALHTAEDHDLWNRLRDIGAVRLSRTALQVVTSGRRVGRAPHGFAQALAAHNSPCVEARV